MHITERRHQYRAHTAEHHKKGTSARSAIGLIVAYLTEGSWCGGAVDGDADEFELLLKVLRGSVDPHALDTTGRATLRKMADMYSFEGILQMLADGSYDATALSEQDARLREQALTIRKALELNTINAAATADDALIDVFAKRASFAYTGVPTSPEATLLYAEKQGKQQRHRRTLVRGRREPRARFRLRAGTPTRDAAVELVSACRAHGSRTRAV